MNATSCIINFSYIGIFTLLPVKDRRSRPEVFLEKGVLKICSKFTGEHLCRSAISINLQSNFIDITLWHGCSPLNLLHIFRTSFSKSTSGWMLLFVLSQRYSPKTTNLYLPHTLNPVKYFTFCQRKLFT